MSCEIFHSKKPKNKNDTKHSLPKNRLVYSTSGNVLLQYQHGNGSSPECCLSCFEWWQYGLSLLFACLSSSRSIVRIYDRWKLVTTAQAFEWFCSCLNSRCSFLCKFRNLLNKRNKHYETSKTSVFIYMKHFKKSKTYYSSSWVFFPLCHIWQSKLKKIQQSISFWMRPA